MFHNGGFGKIAVYKREKKVFSAHLREGLYYADVKTLKDDHEKKITFKESSNSEILPIYKISDKDKGLDVWHCRMLHMAPGALKDIIKNQAVRGFPDIEGDYITCEPCKLAKGWKISFKFFIIYDLKRYF